MLGGGAGALLRAVPQRQQGRMAPEQTEPTPTGQGLSLAEDPKSIALGAVTQRD